MSAPWTQAEAIELCRRVEQLCPAFGCHVALTGGLLYKDGPRKDCDLLFYRIRQVERIDVVGLFGILSLSLGIFTNVFNDALQAGRPFVPSFVIKATWHDKPIDCFFPEVESGDYSEPEVHDGF